MRTICLRRLTLACLLPLAFGCSGPEEEAGERLSSNAGILSYIPADSPYVFVSATPMPGEVQEKLGAYNEQLLKSYRMAILPVLDGEFAGKDGTPVDEEQRKRIRAVVDGVAGLVTEEGMPEAGIDRSSTGALYGVGLLPVLRVALTDDALFESALAGLEEKAGTAMAAGSLDGHPYRYADFGEARVIFAASDDQLVVTLVPQKVSDDLLKSVLGITLPARSIAQSGYLSALAEKYGYQSYGLGFLDFERIAATFLDDRGGVDAELLSLADYDAGSISDVCREEIRSVAGILPRLVTGYTDASAERLLSNTVFELRSDVAAALSEVTAPVPGLGAPHDGLFSFGMSFDIPALRAFYGARLDALEADPYECEMFAGLQRGVAAGREMLDRPVPPVVNGLTGFLAVVDDVTGLDIENQQPPESIDMTILVATSDAENLVAMGAMFSPDIAALDLKPGGKPVKLPLPAAAAGTVDTAYVAMSDKALAVSVGETGPARLESLLAAPPTEPPPFVSVGFDAARYYRFLGEAMKLGQENAADPQSAEAVQATSDMMDAFGEVFSRMAADVEFTGRGIEIPSTIELAP